MAKRKKNKFKLLRFGFLLLLFLILGITTMSLVNQDSFSNPTTATSLIPPGTIIQGVELSNLTPQAGQAKLAELDQEFKQKPVSITYRGIDHAFTLGELGFRLDAAKSINQALTNYQQMGLIKRWQARLHLTAPQLAVMNLDRETTKAALQRIANPLYIPAVDASPLVINRHEQITIKPDQAGFRVEIDQFTEQLLGQVSDNGTLALELPTTTIKPKVTSADVTKWGITGLVAQYTTQFKASLTERSQNIKLAAEALDDLVVPPGKVISFNNVVGPREAEKGYQTAGVIVGNTLTEGLGGGICQVSTTLYNAVLLADLDIVQRGNHNIPIGYAPIGLDSAVSYGSLDLKFKNNTGKYMFIKTSVYGNNVTVKVFGDDREKKNIQLTSWITETIEPKVVYKVDPALHPEEVKVVQQGARGFRAQAQRVVVTDGKEIEKNALPNSYYMPVERIIVVQSEAQISGHEPQETPTVEPQEEPVDAGQTPDSATPDPVIPEPSPTVIN